MFDLTGRTVAVTGGNGGIGLCCRPRFPHPAPLDHPTSGEPPRREAAMIDGHRLCLGLTEDGCPNVLLYKKLEQRTVAQCPTWPVRGRTRQPQARFCRG